MDAQQNVDDLKVAGVDQRHAKAIVRRVHKALEEKPSTYRLERLVAEIRLEVHKELPAFRFQIIWLLVASLAGIVANLVLTFWKH
jgi:hypothetical protein